MKDWERDFIRDELEGLRDSIRAYIRASDSLLSVGFGFFGAFVALSISQDMPALLLAGPVVLTLVYLHAARTSGEILAFGQYRAALERRLEREAQRPVLMWESDIAPLLRKRPFVEWWQGFQVVIYVAAVAAAIVYLTISDLPVVAIVGAVLGYLAMALVVMYVYRSLDTMSRDVADLLAERLGRLEGPTGEAADSEVA